MSEMQAARFHEYGTADVLQIESVPRPEPAAGEVLVRVRAAGVNPIDWKLRSGYLKEWMPVELPAIPGLDLAGTVEAVGDGVDEFEVGEDVFGRGRGSYAEYALASVGTLAPKPAGVGFAEAAALNVGGLTAWLGLFEVADLQPGQRVLIQGGAGGVGALAVQLAHWKGAYVIATSSASNLDFVRTIGADEAVDYGAVRFEDVVEPVDVVFDTVGGEVTERSWSVLRPGGTLIVIASMPDADRAARLGVRVGSPQPPAETAPVLRRLAALVESGDLTIPVGRRYPLAAAAEAQAASETGHGRGRIVLEM